MELFAKASSVRGSKGDGKTALQAVCSASTAPLSQPHEGHDQVLLTNAYLSMVIIAWYGCSAKQDRIMANDSMTQVKPFQESAPLLKHSSFSSDG